ncbi:MAG: recombination regulator RecX [Actinobacteria bacterium]|nr:MAG: recombination regulator RecX [Actinomycetota bacterium]
MEDEARLQAALELAYRQLGRRDRTVAELRWYLRRRELDAAAIEGAIAVLTDQGYLDDARYAARFAEDRRALDGWGSERIARRLEEAGIAPELIAAAVAGHDPEDEIEAAVSLLRRRLTAPPADDRARERALGLLVRRGYELEVAYDAVRAFERDAA